MNKLKAYDKTWNQVTQDDLFDLYIEKDLIKSEIAAIFNVSKKQVEYKLKKYGINKQKSQMRKALETTFESYKKETIERVIFGSELINADLDSDEPTFGIVKVIAGEYEGRIGYCDDYCGDYGYVFWGEMVNSLDYCYEIPLKYLSNTVTVYDVVSRANSLSSQLSRYRTNSLMFDVDDVITLYDEYVYTLKILNQIYVDTVFLRGTGMKKVFISHSSIDKQISAYIAMDLERSGYDVWFDMWDIDAGQSIPQSISDGLDNCNALIIILSKSYLESAFCKDEWQGFYMKYRKHNKPIFVVIIDNSEVPSIIASLKYIRFDPLNKEEYDDMIHSLKKGLKKIIE